MMRNMKKVQYEELSDEAISAARRRRSREVERDSAPDIDEIELPENHPFAVKQTVTAGEPFVHAVQTAGAHSYRDLRPKFTHGEQPPASVAPEHWRPVHV
jgi:hypothetical protein